MTKRFYLDTNIWIDVYEDRKGFGGEPLGEYGGKLLAKILAEGKIVISDILLTELEVFYSVEQIRGMLLPFEKRIERIISTKKQRKDAWAIQGIRNIPQADAMHAVLARDHKLILITRDKHFKELQDICHCYRPEELI